MTGKVEIMHIQMENETSNVVWSYKLQGSIESWTVYQFVS